MATAVVNSRSQLEVGVQASRVLACGQQIIFHAEMNLANGLALCAIFPICASRRLTNVDPFIANGKQACFCGRSDGGQGFAAHTLLDVQALGC